MDAVGQAGRSRRAVFGQGQPRQWGCRVQNNNYERENETVYTMASTAEEIDYLDSKAEGETLRTKQGPASGEGQGDDEGAENVGQSEPAAHQTVGSRAAKSARNRKTEDVPF